MRKVFTQQNILLALKITLPILYALTLIFIFSQSLQTGEQSAKTSSGVVETVQAVVKILAPQSPIATAEGEALQRLHSSIRTLAHFAEFAVLGAISCGCWLVYTWGNSTQKKKGFFVGVIGLIAVPIIDEFIQSFTANRTAEFIDFIVDLGGGLMGFGITLACFCGVVWLIKKYENKQTDTKQGGEQS